MRPFADKDSTISPHPGQPTLALAHDLRLERSRGVPQHPHLDRADVGEHGLAARSVAAVTAAAPDRVVLVVAEMVGDLALQSGFQHPLGELLQQTPPSPVNCRPSPRARSTSIAINCSSLIALDTRPGPGSTDSDSTTAVSDIWRLSLDHQIRR